MVKAFQATPTPPFQATQPGSCRVTVPSTPRAPLDATVSRIHSVGQTSDSLSPQVPHCLALSLRSPLSFCFLCVVPHLRHRHRHCPQIQVLQAARDHQILSGPPSVPLPKLAETQPHPPFRPSIPFFHPSKQPFLPQQTLAPSSLHSLTCTLVLPSSAPPNLGVYFCRVCGKIRSKVRKFGTGEI